MGADLWVGSFPVATGPAAETAALSVCLLVGEDGDRCHRPVEIMTTVPAEVLLHHIQVGFLGGTAVAETCPLDIRTEEGKISIIGFFSQIHAMVKKKRCYLYY